MSPSCGNCSMKLSTFNLIFTFGRVIFDNFSNPNQEVKDNAAGIQLLGVVLANGLSPISADSRIDEKQ